MALFAEMYGYPLTIYLLSGWLGARFPGIDFLSHDAGHLLEVMFGWRAKVVNESTGEELKEPNQKGVVAIAGPLPPGCMQTVWRDDARFVDTYWKSVPGRLVYSTFDWGIRDQDGYFYILGRTDDVINVAGHRLGTREIEESISSHPNVAEVAVVGVADQLKGQVAVGFAVLKDPSLAATPEAALKLEGEIMKTVDSQLGAVARPARRAVRVDLHHRGRR